MNTDPHHNRRTLADLTDEEHDALAAMLAEVAEAFSNFHTAYRDAAETIQDKVNDTWKSLEPLRKAIAHAQLDGEDDDETRP